jgi:hypothetical protein
VLLLSAVADDFHGIQNVFQMNQILGVEGMPTYEYVKDEKDILIRHCHIGIESTSFALTMQQLIARLRPDFIVIPGTSKQFEEKNLSSMSWSVSRKASHASIGFQALALCIILSHWVLLQVF